MATQRPCQRTQEASTLSSCIRVRHCSAVVLKLKGKTLEIMGTFRVYCEVEKNKAGHVAAFVEISRQHNPPVCQELACSRLALFYHKIGSISPLANSRHNQESELALCPRPQRYPNLLLCCDQAPTPHLVF